VRILIFHGYLLAGTGSNVYNARLAEALVGMGHDVHLLCQERHPEQHAFIGATGDWDSGALRVRRLHACSTREATGSGGSCTVYRPNIGQLLPVYVADRYEGLTATTFSRCSDGQVERYVQANVSAVAELCDLVRPQLALANHLVMGPAILARGMRGGAPFAVKVHGSALEYTVKAQPERFLPYAREGLSAAAAVLVGSRHTAESLWLALGEPWLPARTRLGPPGVDVERFAPSAPAPARARVAELAQRLRGEAVGGEAGAESFSAFSRSQGEAAAALERLAPGDRVVAFVGKLIVSKGVDLLIAAFPLVLADIPGARLLLVGFGAYREGCERLLLALGSGDLDAALAVAAAGRSLEDPTAEAVPLRHLQAFLQSLGGVELERYMQAAAGLHTRVLLSGRLEHEELAEVLPACEALVVPSTFPEAFGMVAAEAAACGVLPVSAAHSGLAEVSRELALAVPAEAAGWLSFAVDERSVRSIAACLTGWLGAEADLREQTRQGLRRTAAELWSWQGVARRVLDAAAGRLEALAHP
jgi:glycosyltransferase involved in cell wall biosynthesis